MSVNPLPSREFRYSKYGVKITNIHPASSNDLYIKIETIINVPLADLHETAYRFTLYYPDYVNKINAFIFHV
jgi:hypothetical protein